MTVLMVSQAVALASLPKAVITFGLIVAWARWATIVDKDAERYQLNRRAWNLSQVAAALVAFAALFLVPYFILGLMVALLVLGGAGAAYAAQHNRIAPEKQRWSLNIQSIIQNLQQRRQQRAAKNATLRFCSRKDMPGVPTADDPNHEAHVMFEELIEQGLRRDAQRIELNGSETGFSVQLIIDNHAYRQGSTPPAETIAMLDYLKAQCSMDTEERRKKQTGECKVESEEFGEHFLRVKTAGSTRGVNCTIVVDPRAQLSIPFSELGMHETQRERLKPLLEETGKVVLVAAPPGQGRSTTLYALMQEHDPYVLDMHMFVPAMEREMEGVTIHETAPEDTPTELQSLLLRDPQVVTVSSVQKPDLAKVIAGAATDPEGPRLYAGIKAPDTFKSLRLWTKAVGDPKTVAPGLGGVIAQRLLRKLCQVCRQKYQPDADAMRKLNLPVDRIQNLYKASGKIKVKNNVEPCPACHGLGYRGLTAVFEVMVFDDEARELLASGKTEALRTHLRRQKMMWLQEAALAKVVAGTTSISEITDMLAKEEAAAVA